ncbi:MAG: phosphate ABC transporter permease subunit PstC [Actinomycetota bacterium]
MATTTRDPGLTVTRLRGSPRRRRKEAVVHGLLAAAAGISLVISLAIVIALLGQAVVFLSNVDPGVLWTEGWRPRSGEFDIPTIFIGTLEVSVIAMLIATPLGLGAAMYLSEYANPKTRRRLKPILETLAGIPSVVLGYFALQVINPAIVQDVFGSNSTFTIMAAGIGVGILTIPLVASVAEDAMYAVPGALREAAYGIGARRRTVTTRVVFPAAVSGIVASLILGFSRALGETMVVAIAAGATSGASRHWNPFEPGQTMTGAISSLAIGSDQVKSTGGLNPFDSLYFVGLLLFMMTLGLNVVSERFVRRVRKDS